MYLCILVELWRRLRFSWQLLAVLAAIGVTFFLTDFCCSQLIRPMFPRLRPVSVENPIHEMVNAVEGYRQNSHGFPSCHASNTFGLATLMWLFFRHKATTFLMFFWALATCYSRVYLGVHYPGDVFVGAVIGFVCGCLVYKLYALFLNTYIKESRPLTPAPWLIAAANLFLFIIIFTTPFFL